MKRRWKILGCCLLLIWIVPLCSREEPPAQRIVTRVEVSCSREDRITAWTYTQPDKMERVLNYLRLRQPLRVAQEDPERILGPSYLVEVHLSDGGHRIYRLRANRYFSRDNHIWQEIDSEEAATFDLLLQQTPTDIECLPLDNGRHCIICG